MSNNFKSYEIYVLKLKQPYFHVYNVQKKNF